MESAINFAMKKAGVVELEEKHPLSASWSHIFQANAQLMI